MFVKMQAEAGNGIDKQGSRTNSEKKQYDVAWIRVRSENWHDPQLPYLLRPSKSQRVASRIAHEARKITQGGTSIHNVQKFSMKGEHRCVVETHESASISTIIRAHAFGFQGESPEFRLIIHAAWISHAFPSDFDFGVDVP